MILLNINNSAACCRCPPVARSSVAQLTKGRQGGCVTAAGLPLQC